MPMHLVVVAIGAKKMAHITDRIEHGCMLPPGSKPLSVLMNPDNQMMLTALAPSPNGKTAWCPLHVMDIGDMEDLLIGQELGPMIGEPMVVANRGGGKPFVYHVFQALPWPTTTLEGIEGPGRVN
jgi:hypothetical protein